MLVLKWKGFPFLDKDPLCCRDLANPATHEQGSQLVESLSRAIAIIELLARDVDGLELGRLAREADLPASAAHRLVRTLVQHGYVEQRDEAEKYCLSTKFAALGLSYLDRTGLFDVAQPILDRAAEDFGELVLLSVVRADQIVWIAKAQGAREALRYDQSLGVSAHLTATATGQVWLASLPEEDAIALASRQNFTAPGSGGPCAPRTVPQLLRVLRAVRRNGYSISAETSSRGVTAVAVPLRRGEGPNVVGALTAAGPSARFVPTFCKSIVPGLIAAGSALSARNNGSSWLAQRSGNTSSSVLGPTPVTRDLSVGEVPQ